MGCSHSKRKPENVKTGKSRLVAEVKRYEKFDYSEKPAGDGPPTTQAMRSAIPDDGVVGAGDSHENSRDHEQIAAEGDILRVSDTRGPARAAH